MVLDLEARALIASESSAGVPRHVCTFELRSLPVSFFNPLPTLILELRTLIAKCRPKGEPENQKAVRGQGKAKRKRCNQNK